MTKEQAIKILRYNSKVIHQTINGETSPIEVEALDMAIKALEQQENKRTVALIKPSQNTTTLRQLMQQPVVICTANTEVIAQSFISDVESVKDYLPKCNSMEFPKTFDEFANDYGFTDDKEIYTNGSHLIPVFRVKQWLDHIEQQPSEDCVSRQSMLDAITEIDNNVNMDIYTNEVREIIKALPPVTPTQRWIPVSERLPKCEQKVLVLASYRNNTHVITTGMYEDGSLSECDSIWNWEYMDFEKWDDENDCGIITEGWYEYHEYNPDGVLNYAIDTKVIAWKPLPEPYEEKRGSEND